MKPDSEKKPLSSGVGESKKFIAEGERDPFAHIRGLHVGGRPVEEVVPLGVAHLVTREHTDEAIAERNAGKEESAAEVRKVGGDRAPHTATNRDGMLQERYDFRKQSIEPWEAPDPFKELIEAHVPAGMRAKFLGARRTAKDGTRGFEIVRNEKGDPVKLGELMLAQMPEDRAESRNAHYRAKSRERVAETKRRNLEERSRKGAA